MEAIMKDFFKKAAFPYENGVNVFVELYNKYASPKNPKTDKRIGYGASRPGFVAKHKKFK